MIWEISNPHDPYTIEADRFEDAAAAVIYIGRGFYGAHPEDGSDGELPVMLGWTAEEAALWWEAQCSEGRNVEEYIRSNPISVAAALDSVMIGDRKVAETSSMSREEWHDHHRSSVTDLGRRAWDLAQGLRDAKVRES